MGDESLTTDMHGREALQCPDCGGGYLHQQGVDVFSRDSEDSEHGTHISIDYSNDISLDTSMNENPSGRRDGIVIEFECEQCYPDGPTLRIVQHKGNERIYWE